jgi:hypothetical protein
MLVYTVLAAVWAVVIFWQAQEHVRVEAYGRAALRNRSRDIANTLGSFIRGLQFRGAGPVFGDRLQPVLEDLVSGDSAQAPQRGEVVSVVLLNASGEPLASAGLPFDLAQSEILSKGERWTRGTFEMVHSIQGVRLDREGQTNAPVLLPPFTNTMREGRFSRREGRGPPPPPGEPAFVPLPVMRMSVPTLDHGARPGRLATNTGFGRGAFEDRKADHAGRSGRAGWTTPRSNP